MALRPAFAPPDDALDRSSLARMGDLPNRPTLAGRAACHPMTNLYVTLRLLMSCSAFSRPTNPRWLSIVRASKPWGYADQSASSRAPHYFEVILSILDTVIVAKSPNPSRLQRKSGRLTRSQADPSSITADRQSRSLFGEIIEVITEGGKASLVTRHSSLVTIHA